MSLKIQFSSFKKALSAALMLLMSFFVFSVQAASSSSLSPEKQSLMSIRLQINWHPQFEFAGIYAAIKQGYYQKAGLKVTITPWHPDLDVIKDVIKGNQDFGIAYGSAVADFAKGAPIKLVMPNLQFSPMVFLSHTPIDSWEDLQGKKVVTLGNLYLKDLLVKLESNSAHPGNVQFVSGTGKLEDFISSKIDLYAAYETNEPYRLNKQKVPYHIIDPKSYGVQGYGDLIITSSDFARAHPDAVYKFKQATIKGWRYAMTHQPETVDYILAHYKVQKSRDALLDEAQKMTRYVNPLDNSVGQTDPAKLKVMASEAQEVGLINQQEFDNFVADNFIFNAGKLRFTPEELAYLASKPVIHLANDVNWAPFQFIDSKGKYQGITADYFHLLSERLGLKFEVERNKDWNQVVALAKQGKLDVYPCAVPTPDRKKYMTFTKPYLSFPMVLLGKESLSYISHYRQLDGKTVAAVKGGWSAEYLKKHFPNIHVLPVATVKQGIEAVLDGRAMAFSGNLGVINYALHQNGYTGLHIVGQSDVNFDIAIGVQKSNPVLFSILQKGLASIQPQERQGIYNRWIKLEMVKRLDKEQLISIGVTTFAVVFSMLMVLLVYRYQKNKQQAYINQVHELTYATMINMEDFTFEQVSDSYTKLTGYDRSELIGKSYLTLAAQDMTDEQKQQIAQHVRNDNMWKGELNGTTKQGKQEWVETTFTPIKNLLGEVTHVWATRVDITDRVRNEKLSIMDDMTGLYNRRHFNEVIEREINRAKRNQTALSVAMLDIDYFKSINDTYGHQVGDDVLIRVAALFKQSFHRANDFIFRMGGEEFLVLSSMQTLEEFVQHLETVCKEIEALEIKNEASQYGVLTLSIGASVFEPDDLKTSTAVYHEVDEKLYQAKKGGRNCVVI